MKLLRILLALFLISLGGRGADAVDPVRWMGDTNLTATSTDTFIATYTPWTASHSLSLPLAAATCIGQQCPPYALEFLDYNQTLSVPHTLTILPNGTDLINGATSLSVNTMGSRVTMFPVTGYGWYATITPQNPGASVVLTAGSTQVVGCSTTDILYNVSGLLQCLVQSTFLKSASNLADVTNVVTARSNLGLGNSATLNVGTTAGTVAAGDDARIVNALQSASNLADVSSASTSRSNLGLGSAALAATGTSGTTLGYLNGNNTYAGNNTFSGTNTFSSINNFTGTFQSNGVTQTFPLSGGIVGATDTQVLTNKSIDGSEINSGTVVGARLAAIDLSATGNGGVANALPISSLGTIIPDAVLGNFSAVTATPTAGTVPNCSAALTYSTGTHTFGCNSGAGTGTVTSITVATGLSGGTITTTGTISVNVATGGAYTAGTSSLMLDAAAPYVAETTTSFATSPLAFDFSTFYNTKVTLTSNVTSISCSNQKAGQSGTIRFIQDATGTHTLPATFGCNMKFAGGTQPVLSTTGTFVDALTYSCLTSSYCIANLIKNVQ